MDALTIYNFPAQPPKWDRVGIFFVSFAASWTTVVFSGMAFCLWNRHIPALRHRSLPLAFSGILLLHLYWCMAQIVYPIGGSMPIVVAYVVQYMIMGIWFPLGIALFHAANLRFLRVAEMQKQYESGSSVVRMRAGEGGSTTQGWMGRWRGVKEDNKVFVLIGIGMVFQVLLTISMWAACEKYHPGWGIPGSEITGATLPEQLIDLGRGWEWWPSVVWQFVWTWMVAPFLIWRAWGIRDTLGWRTQTIGACVSGLHATPMFLIASYTPVFYTSGINSYFPPSQWIHLNTMFIEIFTIFIPAYQVLLYWRAQRLARTRKCETTSLSTTVSSPPPSKTSGKHSTIELIDRNASLESLAHSDRLYTMTALTRVLSENPAPLQDFSARCDFSGENIAFLSRLASWKETYPSTGEEVGVYRKKAFDAALGIYIDFISPRDADFPLNLSSKLLKSLEAVFEGPARAVLGTPSFEPALPFFEPPKSAGLSSSPPTADGGWLNFKGEVPGGFHDEVFEDAKRHVEMLVLTNTWPKFVRDVLERRGSVDSERSQETVSSGKTVVSRLEKFVAGLRS